jgi:hypothetical protein
LLVALLAALAGALCLLAGLLRLIALLSALLATLGLLAALVLVRICHKGTPLVLSSNVDQPRAARLRSEIGVCFFFVSGLVDLTNATRARMHERAVLQLRL